MEDVEQLETWFRGLGFSPANFLTLTFRNQKTITLRQAWWWWGRYRKQHANENHVALAHRGGGGRESAAFSWVGSHEYTKGGVVHLHILVDCFWPYITFRQWWEYHCGFVWLRPVRGPDMAYVLKYVLKGGADGLRWGLQRPVLTK